MGAGDARILLTGFAPYGGRSINPASVVAETLDGQEIAGARIVGRKIPVDYRRLRESMVQVIDEVDPLVILSLGLWPGESMIRLEQVGVNLADFAVADNGGNVIRAEAVERGGPPARKATLPVWKIHERLLDACIPARLSSTAGTFLCNALLYSTLGFAAARSPAPLAGFIHLPYLPEQVAGTIRESMKTGGLELHGRANAASMSLGEMVSAVSIALSDSVKAAR